MHTQRCCNMGQESEMQFHYVWSWVTVAEVVPLIAQVVGGGYWQLKTSLAGR